MASTQAVLDFVEKEVLQRLQRSPQKTWNGLYKILFRKNSEKKYIAFITVFTYFSEDFGNPRVYLGFGTLWLKQSITEFMVLHTTEKSLE